MGRPGNNITESLLRNRIISGNCWLWALTILPDGYGQMSHQNKSLRVHRASASVYLGFDLKSKLYVLHKRACPHRHCFNPEHLYIGTQKENVRDQVAIGTHVESRKTCCPAGHEYTKENTYLYISKTGQIGRQCRICRDQRNKQRPRRKYID